MVTIYDLLEVDEKSSKEEIENSYQRLVIEYQTNPVLSIEENKQNELILNKLKMAYEILMDDEKRNKYDKNLAKKRAEDLIKNIPEKNSQTDNLSNKERNISNSEYVNNKNDDSVLSNTEIKHTNSAVNTRVNVEKDPDGNYDEIPKAKNTRYKNQNHEEEVELTKDEQKKIRKAAQKEFNENLKRVKKAEEEYNNAYNEAYRKYMKKMGYETKEPWTLKRIRNILISILIIIIVCAIVWIIPPIRKILINTYESNIIIKSFVDIIGKLINGVIGAFE